MKQEEWVGSEDWKKLCNLIGYHPLDGRLALICKIIRGEKKKSRREVLEEIRDSFEDSLYLEGSDLWWSLSKSEVEIWLEEEFDKLQVEENEE